MQRILPFTALLLWAVASPAMAQSPNPGQLLQGLLSGNQGQDQAVRDAFERGYRQGRQDQGREDHARFERGPPPRGPYPEPYPNQGVPPNPYSR